MADRAGSPSLQPRKKARKVPEQFAELYRAVDMGPIRGMRKIAREQMSLWADRFYKTEGG